VRNQLNYFHEKNSETKKNLIEIEFLADFHFSVIEKNLFNDNENSFFFIQFVSSILSEIKQMEKLSVKINTPKNRI